jgi:pantothenate synthetase
MPVVRILIFLELDKTFSFSFRHYIGFCHPETLEDIDYITDEALLALAVKVGKTRLIDNGLINKGIHKK